MNDQTEAEGMQSNSTAAMAYLFSNKRQTDEGCSIPFPPSCPFNFNDVNVNKSLRRIESDGRGGGGVLAWQLLDTDTIWAVAENRRAIQEALPIRDSAKP